MTKPTIPPSNGVKVTIPESVSDPVRVALNYPDIDKSSSAVVIAMNSVAAVDDIEVAWNHDRHQWEIYRDVTRPDVDGGAEIVAGRVLLCAIPAWTEPADPPK